MTDKEIIIDGVDVSKCKHYKNGSCGIETLTPCLYYKDCYYKQLQKEKFENLNNRQIVASAENLIYENSELYKNLKEKEQECEQIKEKYEALKLENQEGYEIVAELKHECEELKKTVLTKCPNCNSEYLTPKGIELYEENKKLKKECEELKERASIAEDNFACEIQARLYHQNEWLKFSKECEELKKQLKTSEKWRIKTEDLNEKFELKNTCYRKALEEIEGIVKNFGSYAAWQEQRINKILAIINKAKDGQ